MVGDPRAGRVEASLVLALAPDLVGHDRPVGVTEPLNLLLPRLWQHGVKAVAENGVLGDERGASAREGHRLLGQFVAEISALLDPTPNAAP